jgi:trehalose synthase
MTATTLQPVEVPARRWSEFEGLGLGELLDEGRELAGRLAGARVLEVNATAYGGGVAEILNSEIALLRDLGLNVEWRLLCPDGELFEITKRLHNAMQGQAAGIGDDAWAIYLEHNAHCARMVGDEWDLVVVHDPQPAGLVTAAGRARWVWRCHLDTSTPDPEAWSRLRPLVAPYDALVFTLDRFRPPGLADRSITAIAPAIDPLAAKNRQLPPQLRREIVARFGLDTGRPLVVQVSRFDPWKDPLGVLDAWRLARQDVPGLQLALVGAMAADDPEARDIYEQVREAASGEPDCHLLTDQNGVGAVEVNAFQAAADVAIQKSIREGFGLTVSEAMWKETPVVGGDAGGIPVQIGEDEGGVVVDDVQGCAEALVALLHDPELRKARGRAGRERVRKRFLLPRLVRDELRLYADLLEGSG